MSNKTKHQHYVPRFYLKGFGNYKRSKYLVYVYNKENNKDFLSSINNIGHENYFYEKNDAKKIEKLFSQFEKKFNIALRKIIKYEDLNKLNQQDKTVLSYFISIQWIRTREKRIAQKQMIESLIDFIGEQTNPNYRKGSTTLTEESFQNIHLSTIFENFTDYANIMLNEMVWFLGINDTDTPLWTSDNPCTLYNELEPDQFEGSLGLKCRGFQLHFPLSSKLLLIFSNPHLRFSDLGRAKMIKDKEFKKQASEIEKDKDFDLIGLLPPIENLIEERIIFENCLQIKFSTQFLFSKDNDFSLAVKFLNEHLLYKDKNRPRFITNV